MQRRELGLEEIRSLTLEALRNFANGSNQSGGGLQFGTLIPEVAVVAASKGLVYVKPGADLRTARLTGNEIDNVREVISSFINQEILMWGISEYEAGPPWLSLTTYGKEVLAKGEIIPHDRDGYLRTFTEKVPQANDLILKYLVESLETFHRGNLLASPVMLGVASEAAFLILFDSMKKALTNPKTTAKFERLEQEISTKKKFDAVMQELTQIKKKLPRELEESIETDIQGIFNLIRHERNDSGHPTGKQVSRSQMFNYLQLFISYCGSLFRLVDWLKDNQI